MHKLNSTNPETKPDNEVFRSTFFSASFPVKSKITGIDVKLGLKTNDYSQVWHHLAGYVFKESGNYLAFNVKSLDGRSISLDTKSI